MSVHKHTEQKTASDVLINFIMERTKPNGQNFSDKEAHQLLKALENARTAKAYVVNPDLKVMFEAILRGWSQLTARDSEAKSKSSTKDLTIQEANLIIGTAIKEISETEKRKVPKRSDEPEPNQMDNPPAIKPPKTETLNNMAGLKPRKVQN